MRLHTRGVVFFEHPEITQLTTTGSAGAAAISQDGKYVAYATGVDEQSLRLRQVATGTDLELLPPAMAGYEGITFSPDSAYIYYLNVPPRTGTGDLFTVPVLGGTPRKLIHHLDSGVAFSPDGNCIAFIRGNIKQRQNALTIAKADGTEERIIARRKSPQRFEGALSWSPDGELIAVGVSGPLGMHVSVISPNGKHEKNVGPTNWEQVDSIAWLRDGQALIVAAMSRSGLFFNQIWEISYPDGRVRPITKETSKYFSATITANSDVLSVVRGDAISNLWIAKASALGPGKTGSEIRQLTTGTGKLGTYELAWAGEGRLLYSVTDKHSQEIGATDVDGKNGSQITHGEQISGEIIHGGPGPGFCDCSRYIVFESHREDEASLCRIDADGSNRKLLAQPAELASCSPDGTWVKYISGTESDKEFKIDVESGAAVPVRGEPPYAVASPNGQRIAYWTEASPRRRVLAIAPAGGRKPIGTIDHPSGALWRWDPNSQDIDFVKYGDGGDNIWRASMDGRAPKPLTHFDSGKIFNFAWSPDGKMLAFSKGAAVIDVVLIRNAEAK